MLVFELGLGLAHPPASRTSEWSLPARTRPARCQAPDDNLLQLDPDSNIPVPFRPLDRQEIVDVLNAVPTFSVVNQAEEMFATVDKSGALGCNFYLEPADAQEALAELRASNPRLSLELSVAPLGTAFALCEWDGLPQPLWERTDRDGAGEDGAEETSGMVGSIAVDEGALLRSADEPTTVLRLLASGSELEAVGTLLDESPAPPLLRQRNRQLGGIPLFGSDAIRFQMPGDDGETSTVRPLFFRREDFRDAWLASGGPADGLPPAQVADLRTLAFQMQFDSSQDWRDVILVASEPAIAFVREQQAQLPPPEPEEPAAQESEEGAGASVQLSKADVQALIFGS